MSNDGKYYSVVHLNNKAVADGEIVSIPNDVDGIPVKRIESGAIYNPNIQVRFGPQISFLGNNKV